MKILAKRVTDKWEEKEIEIKTNALTHRLTRLFKTLSTFTPTEYALRGELTQAVRCIRRPTYS